MTTDLQTVELWIDTLAALWEIDAGVGKTVRSFRIMKRNEFPAAINPSMCPCAITYPTSVEPKYSQGGPCLLFWEGQTEMHLTKDVKPANLPYLFPFFGRIVVAAASKMQLGGLVTSFRIREANDAIKMWTFVDKDGKPDHEGFIVKWEVKQTISGQLTVGL